MEKIQGMVSDIVFKNEENGYTIANLANEDDEITIVGCMPTLSMGESIEVEGKWINHKISCLLHHHLWKVYMCTYHQE